MKKLTALVLVIGLLLATWGVGQAALIGYWPLDETSGTIAPNLAPGGTDGTLYNGPVWMTDPTRGQVLSFDGGDDYVSAGTIPAIAMADDFTWAFWTYQQQGENNDVIVGNRYGGSGWVKFTANAFEYRSASGGDIDYANIAQNAWVHHAVVKTGDTFVYYRDGADSGLSSTTTSDGGAQPFFLGGDSGGERWQGRLDDVGIWTEALSAGDINTIYTGGIAALLTPVLTWDGVANGNWSDSARWTGPKPPNFPDATVKAAIGPTGSNNTVTVNGNYAAHTVDVTNNGALVIGTGNTLDVANSLNAAGRPITMQNNSTLLVGAPSAIGTLTTQGNATLGGTGDVVVSGSTFDGGGATGTFTKTGPGTLSLDNSGGTGVIGVENMTFDVHEGTLFSKGAQPLGGTDPTTGVPAGIILSGGTLSVEGAPASLNMLQAGRFQDGNFQQDFSAGGGAYTDDGSGIFSGQQLLSGTPGMEEMQTGPLSYASTAAFNTFWGTSGDPNEWQAVWTGYYVAQNPGVHQFRIQNAGGGGIDDDGSLWIDADQSGTFESGEGGTTGGTRTQTTIALTAGQSYAVAFGFNENSGGESYRVQFMEPSGTYTSWTTVDPTAQAGLWSSISIGAIDMTGTPISVTANSGLNAISDLPPAAFGHLTLNDAVTLSTSGAPMTFLSTTLAGNSAALDVGNDVTAGPFDAQGATGTFTKTGPGTLSLDNSGGTGVIGVQNMTFDVHEGTLYAVGAQPLGGTSPTTGVPLEVILSGGTLEVEGATVIGPGRSGWDFEDGTLDGWNIVTSPWGGPTHKELPRAISISIPGMAPMAIAIIERGSSERIRSLSQTKAAASRSA